MTHYVRENETGYQDFTLYDENGAYLGTGTTVDLVLTDRSGGQVDMTGKTAWLVAASGTVRVSPAAGDLVASRAPYQAAFIVTLSGRTYAFPSGKTPDIWEVWK